MKLLNKYVHSINDVYYINITAIHPIIHKLNQIKWKMLIVS